MDQPHLDSLNYKDAECLKIVFVLKKNKMLLPIRVFQIPFDM